MVSNLLDACHFGSCVCVREGAHTGDATSHGQKVNKKKTEKRRHENSAKVKYLVSFSVCEHRSSLFRVFCRVDLSHVSSSIHRYVFQLREVRGLALSPLRRRKEVEKTGFSLCCKVCPLFTRLFLLLYGKMNVFHFPMSD